MDQQTLMVGGYTAATAGEMTGENGQIVVSRVEHRSICGICRSGEREVAAIQPQIAATAFRVLRIVLIMCKTAHSKTDLLPC